MGHPGGRLSAWLFAALAVTSLTACAKTVEWEEEVPLNTGEKLWVKRSVEYERGSNAGNPFDIIWRTRSGSAVLAFQWRGKDYRFDLHGGPTVLAISPEGKPVVLAPAGAGAWDRRNHYRCTVPFYVQFVPDESGRQWTWPPSVDPAFHNLEANLLQALPKPGDAQRRFTASERAALHRSVLAQSPARKRIDPAYRGDRCENHGKEKN